MDKHTRNLYHGRIRHRIVTSITVWRGALKVECTSFADSPWPPVLLPPEDVIQTSHIFVGREEVATHPCR